MPTSSNAPGVENLNMTATMAFRKLLDADTTLLPDWKKAALKLSSNGIPEDISELEKLLKGEANADS